MNLSSKQQRRQSHSIEQQQQERNAINFIGLSDQSAQVDASTAAAAATLRQSMLASNHNNAHRQQQPQTGSGNGNPLGMNLLQQGNLAAVARLLENNRTNIANSSLAC